MVYGGINPTTADFTQNISTQQHRLLIYYDMVTIIGDITYSIYIIYTYIGECLNYRAVDGLNGL